MRASLASILLIAGVILSPMPLTQADGTQVTEHTTNNANLFVITNNARVIIGPWHYRQITVFVEPQEFTIENVRAILVHLSETYPAEDSLWVDAFSDHDLVKDKARWFAGIRSFPFGNVPPDPTCASGAEPARLSAQYSRGNGSEHFVFYQNNGEPIDVYLRNSSPDCKPSGDPAVNLVDASMRGCEDTVVELLNAGIDPKVKAKHGGVALVEAAYWGSGHPEIVERLLDGGANIDQTSSSGWTALMAAAYGNRSKTIDLLLDRGANVNAIGEDGRNALIIATLRQYHGVVRKLLARRADPNSKDGYGKTPLSIAKEQHDRELIRILKTAGAVR